MRKINIENHKKFSEKVDPEIDFLIETWMDIVDFLTDCGYRKNEAWGEDEEENYQKLGELAVKITDKAKKAWKIKD